MLHFHLCTTMQEIRNMQVKLENLLNSSSCFDVPVMMWYLLIPILAAEPLVPQLTYLPQLHPLE